MKSHKDMDIKHGDHEMLIFRYIECCGNCKKIVRLRKLVIDDERNNYDAEKVKDYLIHLIDNGMMEDPSLLLHCCNECGFTADTVKCLYSNGFYKYIENYIIQLIDKDKFSVRDIVDIVSVLRKVNGSDTCKNVHFYFIYFLLR